MTCPGKLFENPQEETDKGPSLHSPRHGAKAGVNQGKEPQVI